MGLETFALALANEGGQINVPCGGVVGWYRSLALVNGFWSCSIYILFTLFIPTSQDSRVLNTPTGSFVTHGVTNVLESRTKAKPI